MVIFATSNSRAISKPLLSRFTVFEIPEYTYEEFETISVRIIKKLNQNAVKLVWNIINLHYVRLFQFHSK
jgi:ATP-dependent Lon protease